MKQGALEDETSEPDRAAPARSPRSLWDMGAAARMRLILKNIHDAVIVTDAGGVVVDWNEGATRVFGWTAEEMIGHPYADRFSEPQRTFVAEQMRLRLEGDDWDGEYEDVRKDGSAVWIDARVRRILDDEGRAVGIIGVSHDITERKRAEAALRERDELERDVLDSMDAHVAVLGPDGRIRAVNRAWRQFTIANIAAGAGYPASCDVGANYLTVCAVAADEPTGVALTTRQGILDVLSGTRPRFELEYPCDGPTKAQWFSLVVTPLRGGKGGCVVAHLDVTARKLAERKVSEHAATLVLALSVARMGVWELDVATRTVSLAAGLQVFPGGDTKLGLDEVIGLVHDDDVRAVRQWLERTIAERRSTELEIRIVPPDGEVRWAAVNAQINAFSDETRVVGTYQDITERRKADAALRHAQSVARVGDWTVDLRTKSLTGSEEAHRIFGLGPEPHTCSDLAELVHPADRARVDEAWNAMLAGAPECVEHRMIVGGKTRWVETRARREHGRDGDPGRVVGVTQDITARRHLEQELRQAQKMEAVGQLAGGVAHDFNNLLTVINGFAATVLDALEPGDPLRPQVVEIQSAGERAAALTARLLTFSRRTVIEPKVLDLNDLTESTLRLLRRIIGEHIILSARFDPRLGRVKIDPAQFEQVIMNLAINARDAMPSGGRLMIETEDVHVERAISNQYGQIEPGRYACLTVADTGSGMSEDVQRHIFEPFFTTKGLGKGTGLGLAMVFGAVQQAGGRLAVESEPDRGARFKVLLPVTEARPSRLPEPIQKAPRGAETVLLAEDEVGVRKLGKLTLEAQGYTVIDAASGEEAIERAARHEGPIDLLVTDVVMPGIGGRELADAISAERPGIKVLYMSGYIDDDMVRHGVTASRDAFLQKPFSRLSLAEKVREVLDGAASSGRSGPGWK